MKCGDGQIELSLHIIIGQVLNRYVRILSNLSREIGYTKIQLNLIESIYERMFCYSAVPFIPNKSIIMKLVKIALACLMRLDSGMIMFCVKHL